jgi:hypothetical protein
LENTLKPQNQLKTNEKGNARSQKHCKKMKNVFTSVTDKLSITKERISESEEIYKKKMEQSV